MRKEKTVRDELDRLLLSKYHRFNHEKAGGLFWVLGVTSTIQAGIKKSMELEQKP